MKTKTRFILCITALGLLAGFDALLLSQRAAAAEPSKAQITILYDAFGKPSAMEKDWGFAALIEYGGKRILFDTGDNPDILANNAKARGVDLSKLDFAILSHRHGDHMGGMEYLLSVRLQPQSERTVLTAHRARFLWISSAGEPPSPEQDKASPPGPVSPTFRVPLVRAG